MSLYNWARGVYGMKDGSTKPIGSYLALRKEGYNFSVIRTWNDDVLLRITPVGFSVLPSGLQAHRALNRLTGIQVSWNHPDEIEKYPTLTYAGTSITGRGEYLYRDIEGWDISKVSIPIRRVDLEKKKILDKQIRAAKKSFLTKASETKVQEKFKKIEGKATNFTEAFSNLDALLRGMRHTAAWYQHQYPTQKTLKSAFERYIKKQRDASMIELGILTYDYEAS